MEELLALGLGLLRCVPLMRIFLVKFCPADRARVVLFEPILDAAAVEDVVARQFAAGFTFRAFLKADVAILFSTFFLLWQVLDEVGRTTASLRLVLLSMLLKECFDWASLSKHLASKEATLFGSSEELSHELVSGALRCTLRATSHVDTCDLWLVAVRSE